LVNLDNIQVPYFRSACSYWAGFHVWTRWYAFGRCD